MGEFSFLVSQWSIVISHCEVNSRWSIVDGWVVVDGRRSTVDGYVWVDDLLSIRDLQEEVCRYADPSN